LWYKFLGSFSQKIETSVEFILKKELSKKFPHLVIFGFKKRQNFSTKNYCLHGGLKGARRKIINKHNHNNHNNKLIIIVVNYNSDYPQKLSILWKACNNL
jgi:hypothetical protein